MKFIILTLFAALLASIKSLGLSDQVRFQLSPLTFPLSTIFPARDTLFLDSKHKEVKKRKQAEYFKVVTKTDTGYVEELLTSTKQLHRKTTFKDADLKIMNGYSVFYAGKTIDSQGRYENGRREGLWKYYLNGNLSGSVVYKNDKIASAGYFKPNGDPEIDMTKVERLPSFPGGPKGFSEYLTRTLKYPPEAREKKITGTVVLEFTVSARGQIMDVDVISSVSHDIDREAVRVVSSMPFWNPGIQFGRPVKVRYKMPLSFRLG